MTELSDNKNPLTRLLNLAAQWEAQAAGMRKAIQATSDSYSPYHEQEEAVAESLGDCAAELREALGAQNPAALLEIASAALELAGVKAEHDDSSGIRQYKLNTGEVYVLTYGSIAMRLNDAQALNADEATSLASILLHAARTAREWASEGGES